MFQKIKNWYWFTFKIKKDEFHKSLDLSHVEMLKLNKEDREKYIMNIVKKRNLAHEMDIKEL